MIFLFLIYCASLFFETSAAQNKNHRIVGGTDASTGEFPYQGYFEAIRLDGYTYSCGCSLLSSKWAVTAAHCTNGILLEDEEVRLYFGVLFKAENNSFFKVRKIYQHPDYSPEDTQKQHDISLLRIDGEVKTSSLVSAIKLPSSDDQAVVNQSCTITGWGFLSEGGVSPKILQKASVPVLSNEECQLGYHDTEWIINSNQMCAGYLSGGIDSCQGDSGGPLACESPSGSPVLHGVTSFGEGCARPNRPGVYTRVTSYVEWITETMKNGVTTMQANVYVLTVCLLFYSLFV